MNTIATCTGPLIIFCAVSTSAGEYVFLSEAGIIHPPKDVWHPISGEFRI